MRSLVRAVLLLAAWPAFATSLFFHVVGDDHGAWPAVLSSIGLRPGPVGPAGVIVIPSGAGATDPEQWIARGPAVCAEPLEAPEAAALQRVKVWRWTCPPADSLP